MTTEPKKLGVDAGEHTLTPFRFKSQVMFATALPDPFLTIED
jgi:hypothetical protein